VAGGSVKELWLTNEQWGWWAAKMLGTSQPTLRKLFENGGAPVYSWVKNKGTCDREVVKRDLDKRGINMSNNIVNSLERQTCLLPWRAHILMKSWFSFELSQDLNPLTPYS
jgi:hypothetical protein